MNTDEEKLKPFCVQFKKDEANYQVLGGERVPPIRVSGFGFPSGFGFRISDLRGTGAALQREVRG
jgi:hypothetical protein